MSKNIALVSVKVSLPGGHQTYEIDKSEFIIGRGTNADVVVNDKSISREHLRVKIENNKLNVQDIKSMNGTYILGRRMMTGQFLPVENNCILTFGESRVRIQLSLNENIQKPESSQAIQVIDKSESHFEEQKTVIYTEPAPKGLEIPSPIQPEKVHLRGFASTEEEVKISFKDASLNIPEPRNVSAQAKALIEEAQLQKKSILQGAETQRLSILNEAKILTRKAHDQALEQYQKMVDDLLSQTKSELTKMRLEAESELDAKRKKTNEEIKLLWQQHEVQIEEDKKNALLQIEKEGQLKNELAYEKLQLENQVERNKLLDQAHAEIEKKRDEFLAQTSEYEKKLTALQEQIKNFEENYRVSKTQKEEIQATLTGLQGKLESENQNLSSLEQKLDELKTENSEEEKKLEDLKQSQSSTLQAIKDFENTRDSLKLAITTLSEKKLSTGNELDELMISLKEAKEKAKAEIESEYAKLKDVEAKKFSEYKTNELKELQKIRDSHAESLRKMSIELAQEITTKLELLASKSGYSKFNFEKNFEIVNTTIEFKNTSQAGDEPSQTQNLENWKNRKRKEDTRLLATGFVAAIVAVYSFNYINDRLRIDPAKVEMQRIAMENEKARVANMYVPTKSAQYHDNYVESVLYTENFFDLYMDDKIQREWVNYATKYFLKHWRVDEEKVIKVISNSKALVQNISDEVPNLKKSKIKTDLAKLKELEENYIKQQSEILGTNVKYEAYKKIEKDFFNSRLKTRQPAAQ